MATNTQRRPLSTPALTALLFLLLANYGTAEELEDFVWAEGLTSTHPTTESAYALVEAFYPQDTGGDDCQIDLQRNTLVQHTADFTLHYCQHQHGTGHNPGGDVTVRFRDLQGNELFKVTYQPSLAEKGGFAIYHDSVEELMARVNASTVRLEIAQWSNGASRADEPAEFCAIEFNAASEQHITLGQNQTGAFYDSNHICLPAQDHASVY